MSAPIKFCEKHQIDRVYRPKQNNYRCPICHLEGTRRYRLANLDRERARLRAYGKANPDKVRAHSHTWKIAHPDKVRAYWGKPETKEHARYYKLSWRSAQRLASMSDPCAILRDV